MKRPAKQIKIYTRNPPRIKAVPIPVVSIDLRLRPMIIPLHAGVYYDDAVLT